MNKVVGIQFENHGRVHFFDSGHFVLKKDDAVMVMTEDGPAIGFVCTDPMGRTANVTKRPLEKIFRLATREEIEKRKRISIQEESIYKYCIGKIGEKSVPMCIVSVKKSFDGSKILVYFTADGRVDFRELVKDFVKKYRTRIEMKQIGVRHEARMVGGLGICGRPMCCAAHLSNFSPVTIRMAKEQNISLNPRKISGMCGRLMCCLAYEYEYYEKIKRTLPKIGKRVATTSGEGKIIRQNILKETLTVILESGDEIEVGVSDLAGDVPSGKKPKKSRR